MGELELKKSAFTVDVEDGISLAMFHDFGVESPQTNRVVTHTRMILKLLEEHSTKGTFFVLGKVAEEFPDLIRDISNGGHELGVHGYNHYQFFKMTREIAFDEISRAKKLIEDISGNEVKGHRAPAFSITPETRWGLDIIAEAGFSYDSSIMPMKGRRYGWPGFEKNICKISTPSGAELIEVPLSTTRVFGKEVPVCGGGYLRLYPYSFSKWAFKKIVSQRPVILYMHPYELDTNRYPDYYYDELAKASLLKRYKMKSMWLRRSSMLSKINSLLSKYEFTTLDNLISKSA